MDLVTIMKLPENISVPLFLNVKCPIKKTNPNHDGKTYQQRFLEKLCFGLSDCWYWRGSRNRHGYGSFNGKKAHRVSYEMFKGEIQKGMFVLHRCDVRNCVNPDHLFLGTQDDNMKDCAAKKRIVNKPQFGSKNHHAKLTEDKVIQMRRLREEQGLTYTEIGKIFNVTVNTALRAVKKESWKHI